MADLADENIPLPQHSMVVSRNEVKMICPETQMTIERIAQYLVTVRDCDKFLRRKTRLSELVEFHVKNRKMTWKPIKISDVINESSSKERDQRIPSFAVPRFDGLGIDGQEYVDSVRSKFKE